MTLATTAFRNIVNLTRGRELESRATTLISLIANGQTLTTSVSTATGVTCREVVSRGWHVIVGITGAHGAVRGGTSGTRDRELEA